MYRAWIVRTNHQADVDVDTNARTTAFHHRNLRTGKLLICIALDDRSEDYPYGRLMNVILWVQALSSGITLLFQREHQRARRFLYGGHRPKV